MLLNQRRLFLLLNHGYRTDCQQIWCCCSPPNSFCCEVMDCILTSENPPDSLLLGTAHPSVNQPQLLLLSFIGLFSCQPFRALRRAMASWCLLIALFLNGVCVEEQLLLAVAGHFLWYATCNGNIEVYCIF